MTTRMDGREWRQHRPGQWWQVFTEAPHNDELRDDKGVYWPPSLVASWSGEGCCVHLRSYHNGAMPGDGRDEDVDYIHLTSVTWTTSSLSYRRFGRRWDGNRAIDQDRAHPQGEAQTLVGVEPPVVDAPLDGRIEPSGDLRQGHPGATLHDDTPLGGAPADPAAAPGRDRAHGGLMSEEDRPDLCRLPMPATNDNDFPGSCVRRKGHSGRCKKISNGMTEAEVQEFFDR